MPIRKRQIQEGKILVKPDWRTVRKILRALLGGKMKRTPLSMRVGKNYNECVTYFTFLETLELVKKYTDEDGFEMIRITGRGREYYGRQFAGKHHTLKKLD